MMYPFKLYSILLGLYSWTSKYKALETLSTGSFRLCLQDDPDLPTNFM